MPIFPPVIPIKDLQFYNKEFDAQVIEKHKALYNGGESFKKIAHNFLSMREIEKIHPKEFQKRLARTPYIPHTATIDYLISAVMRKEPVVTGPSDYWESLNTDADGDGTDLAMIARHLLLDALLHGRSWLEVYFDDDFLPDNDTMIDGNNQDAKLQVVPVGLVDDWGDGFARIHTVCEERDGLWGPMTRTVERWNFLTDSAIAKYEWVNDKNSLNGTVDNNASLVSLEEHDLGICPLIKLEISHPGMWVMNRIDQLLIAIYNRESALQYALDQGCFSLMVLKLNTTLVNQVYASEASALKITPDEDAKFISPDTSVFDAAMKDLERSRTELGRIIHSMTLEQASKVQSPRATGIATKIQQSPLEALLASYAAPVKDILLKAFTAIARMRGEDPSKVVLHGMDDFTGVDSEVEDSPSDEGSDDTSVDNSGSSVMKKE